jgi:hypothetical protein
MKIMRIPARQAFGMARTGRSCHLPAPRGPRITARPRGLLETPHLLRRVFQSSVLRSASPATPPGAAAPRSAAKHFDRSEGEAIIDRAPRMKGITSETCSGEKRISTALSMTAAFTREDFQPTTIQFRVVIYSTSERGKQGIEGAKICTATTEASTGHLHIRKWFWNTRKEIVPSGD